MPKVEYLVLFLAYINLSCGIIKSGIFLNAGTGGYEDIVVSVGDELPRSQCPQILENIKRTLTAGSRSLHSLTDGRVYLDKISIELPHSWGEIDCRTPLSTACLTPTNPRTGDFLVGEDHPVYSSFPFTQQFQGCGQPGEYVYLPYSFLSAGDNTTSSTSGQLVANQFARLRYGLFQDLEESGGNAASPNVASQQHAQCRGKSAREVLMEHDDFRQGFAQQHAVNFTVPRFILLKQPSPKYVIVLENSQAMNMQENSWDYIRAACKKLVVHDLPPEARLGLVLFNEAAHVAYPVSQLGPTESGTRAGIAYSIRNKYNLSPSTASCVRCGIDEAVQTLQGSGMSAEGAVIIVISQGSISSLSLGDEKEIQEVARRHSLQIYSLSLPQTPVVDVNLSLERLAHSTGGESFYLMSSEHESSLGTYVRLVDALTQIYSRTWSPAPQLLHEQRFEPHSEGVYENRGHFTIDKYAGADTKFLVYAYTPFENFIKSMSLQDQRGNSYSNIMDNLANFHVFSIYNVPFQSDQNIGMNWTYSVERLPSADLLNTHYVSVMSSPRNLLENINIRMWSNLDTHAVRITASTPVILYAEVTVGRAPVLDASVVAEVQAINQSGYLSEVMSTRLLDNGNGDPDVRREDGIYSRYLTNLPMEGRYSVVLRVTDNHGKAFAPLKVYGEPTRSCCLDIKAKVSNQKLGAFSRITMGDSFRVHNVLSPGEYPPARILDLSVRQLVKSEELEFTWTSPGDDFDIGKPTSYQLFYSRSPKAFYSGDNRVDVLESFSAAKSAGLKETRRTRVPTLDKTVYYAIVAVDRQGNLGVMSNVVKSLVQERAAVRNQIKSSGPTHSASSAEEPFNSEERGTLLLDVEKPSTILFYLIAGIVSFILLCAFVVMVIVVAFRRRRKKDVDEDDLDSNGTSGGFGEAPPPNSTMLEIAGMDPETKHFLLGSSNQDSALMVGPTHSSLIKDDSSGGESVMENPYGYSNAAALGYHHHLHHHQNILNSAAMVMSDPSGVVMNGFAGWSATTNPYVYKDQQQLHMNETYATIGSNGYNNTTNSYNNTTANSSQDSYVRAAGFQPTYSRPIPKNLRQQQQHQHIYSNAAMVAARGGSPHGSQASIASSRGTVTFQTQAETSIASPDSGSEQAPTPTKSILKKPKSRDPMTSLPRDSPVMTSIARDSPVMTSLARDSPVMTSLARGSPVMMSLARDSPVAAERGRDSPATIPVRDNLTDTISSDRDSQCSHHS